MKEAPSRTQRTVMDEMDFQFSSPVEKTCLGASIRAVSIFTGILITGGQGCSGRLEWLSEIAQYLLSL